ncbi:WXG100 family type VII secretion target [Brevibacillus sp. B_LB10_24]|uniref:WXG100 family type VII secretion target n=1 Tax=Brevibacillus sp. B_LB10_24 TaxID=3380645 RepID=UPI0038B74DBE
MRILLTPEQLYQVAKEFEQANANGQRIIAGLNQTILHLEAQWHGARQMQFYANHQQARQQMEGFLQLMQSVSVQLSEIAQRFQQADEQTDQLQLTAAAAEKKSDDSLLDQIGDAIGDGIGIVGSFLGGVGGAVVDAVEGIVDAVSHPIDTVENIIDAVSHPIDTGKAIWDAIAQSWEDDVVNGDANSRAHWFGNAVGQIGLAIVGTKGVDKAVKLLKGTKVKIPKVPQGLTSTQFNRASTLIREQTGSLSDDVVVQGSRAKGTARPDSDIDFAIKVSPEKFDQVIKERFKTPNPGSAKEKTMLHAIETGKIQAGEAGLRGLRKQLEKELGMDVDISIIKKGGPFDNGPTIPLPK